MTAAGTKRICLTGGEPLLRCNLPESVTALRQETSEEDSSLSSNATRMTRFAKGLKAADLNRVNISLNSPKKT